MRERGEERRTGESEGREWKRDMRESQERREHIRTRERGGEKDSNKLK